MAVSSVTEKVAKLLAQAENAGTEAEADTFMDKAQQLATLYSIDLAKARHITLAKQRTIPIQRTITLGERGTKGLNTLVSLASGIAAANDVTVNIAHNSTYVIGFGFAEDIDITEALFASLSVQMATAVAAYRKTDEWKQDAVYRPYRDRIVWKHDPYCDHHGRSGRGRSRSCRYWGCVRDVEVVSEGGYKPVSWLTARLEFQQAFAERVSARLQQAKRDAEAQAVAADDTVEATSETPETPDTASVGAELVLVEKRTAVRDFYQRNSRARGSYRGHHRNSGAHVSRSAGRSAGDSARLSRNSEIGGARKALA